MDLQKGRRFDSTEIQSAIVPYLTTLIPHEAMNKRFRCQIPIEGVAPNQRWWFLSCDQCTWKSVQGGVAYKCTKEGYTGRTASPRYKLPIIVNDKGSRVEMVFFGDLAQDMIGKAADFLVAQSYVFSSALPPEISALLGRSYVVDVVVSRISFCRDDKTFQVLRFYPQSRVVFMEFMKTMEPLRWREPKLAKQEHQILMLL